VSREATSCKLVLTDSAKTRPQYPFAFRLEVTYSVKGASLDVTLVVTNTGEELLPVSIGAHPAFNWPLVPGVAKEAYKLVFSNEEAAPVRRLKDGLMQAMPEPNPIRGKTLSLSEGLFDDDAVIFDQLVSLSVRFAADHGPSIDLSWKGFRELGVWSKPGGTPLHRTLARICQSVGI
jgi:galactose mutarotase-like enzyme